MSENDLDHQIEALTRQFVADIIAIERRRRESDDRFVARRTGPHRTDYDARLATIIERLQSVAQDEVADAAIGNVRRQLEAFLENALPDMAWLIEQNDRLTRGALEFKRLAEFYRLRGAPLTGEEIDALKQRLTQMK